MADGGTKLGQNGVSVVNPPPPPDSETMDIMRRSLERNAKELNPAAPPFQPKVTSNTTSAQSSKSNKPTLSSTKLNINAAEFVPSSQQYLDESISYTPSDITNGYVELLDSNKALVVVKAAADILINCTMYPAGFERYMTKLTDALMLNSCSRMNQFGGVGKGVCEMMSLLLKTSNEAAICRVCDALKLVGGLLDKQNNSNTKDHLHEIIATLQNFKSSSQCKNMIGRVLMLKSQMWGQPTSPVASTTENPLQELESTLEESSEVPVTNPGEWDDYDSASDMSHKAEQLDHSESIGSDVEEEFEAFIDEIEDFLMKQDMGQPPDDEDDY